MEIETEGDINKYVQRKCQSKRQMRELEMRALNNKSRGEHVRGKHRLERDKGTEGG